MKNLVIVICASAVVIAGCRSVEVSNHGQDYVKDADGKPVLDADGKPFMYSKGWDVDYFQHGMTTQADSMSAAIEKERISFELNKISTDPDYEGMTGLVEKSLSGISELAGKIVAACATNGGSIGLDAAVAYAKKFIAAGGDASKAKITFSDGSVTCTDGSCTVSGSCTDGSCSEK